MPRIVDFKYGSHQVEQIILNGRIIWERKKIKGFNDDISYTDTSSSGMVVEFKLCSASSENDLKTYANTIIPELQLLASANNLPITSIRDEVFLYPVYFKETLSTALQYSDTSEIVISAMIQPFAGDEDLKSYEKVMFVAGEIAKGTSKVESFNDNTGTLLVGKIEPILSEKEIRNNTLIYGYAGIVKPGIIQNVITNNTQIEGCAEKKQEILTSIEHWSQTDYIATENIEFKTKGQSEIWLHSFNPGCAGDKDPIIGKNNIFCNVLTFGLSADRFNFLGYGEINSFLQGLGKVANKLLLKGLSNNITATFNEVFSAQCIDGFNSVNLTSLMDTGFLTISNKSLLTTLVELISTNNNIPTLEYVLNQPANTNNFSNIHGANITLWYPPIGYPISNDENNVIHDKGIVLNVNDGIDIKKKRKRIKIRQAYNVQVINEIDKVLEVT